MLMTTPTDDVLVDLCRSLAERIDVANNDDTDDAPTYTLEVHRHDRYAITVTMTRVLVRGPWKLAVRARVDFNIVDGEGMLGELSGAIYSIGDDGEHDYIDYRYITTGWEKL